MHDKEKTVIKVMDNHHEMTTELLTRTIPEKVPEGKRDLLVVGIQEGCYRGQTRTT
jgi:hypothetical protein